MKLVLDSNIFCQDYRLGSTNFRLLREGLHLIPADLKVPEVVIDEVTNRFRETLEETVIAAEKSDAALNRLLPPASRPQSRKIVVAQETEGYRGWLLAALSDLGAEILPYPDVPHKKVVERDLQRRRPFKRDGSGYRDFLIWESIRKLMHWGTERVIVVTGNLTDFADGQNVAKDLQDDILNPQRLELFPGLKLFNEKLVLPRLTMMDDLKARLQSEVGSSFDIARWLRDRLVDLLQDEELGPIVVGFPDGVGRVRANGISAFGAIEVNDVRKLSKHERLVRITVKADIEFNVDVDWDDYTNHDEVRDWVGDDSEPFSWSSSQHVEKMKIGISLVLDSKGEKLISDEIGSIDGPCGEIELSKQIRQAFQDVFAR